jgi:hypothetical protein
MEKRTIVTPRSDWGRHFLARDCGISPHCMIVWAVRVQVVPATTPPPSENRGSGYDRVTVIGVPDTAGRIDGDVRHSRSEGSN